MCHQSTKKTATCGIFVHRTPVVLYRLNTCRVFRRINSGKKNNQSDDCIFCQTSAFVSLSSPMRHRIVLETIWSNHIEDILLRVDCKICVAN
mmetsp:Transcript_9975/g.20158  ORF Transcript_9975/g.20158 Transcript_9975/m.20158 type:complete len:92 (-) Transcript_9975:1369-1644(-)